MDARQVRRTLEHIKQDNAQALVEILGLADTDRRARAEAFVRHNDAQLSRLLEITFSDVVP